MNQTDTLTVAESDARRPWEPLGFEKIAAADAEAAHGFPGTFDGSAYS